MIAKKTASADPRLMATVSANMVGIRHRSGFVFAGFMLIPVTLRWPLMPFMPLLGVRGSVMDVELGGGSRYGTTSENIAGGVVMGDGVADSKEMSNIDVGGGTCGATSSGLSIALFRK